MVTVVVEKRSRTGGLENRITRQRGWVTCLFFVSSRPAEGTRDGLGKRGKATKEEGVVFQRSVVRRCKGDATGRTEK
jgi:hypothetical protein